MAKSNGVIIPLRYLLIIGLLTMTVLSSYLLIIAPIKLLHNHLAATTLKPIDANAMTMIMNEMPKPISPFPLFGDLPPSSSKLVFKRSLKKTPQGPPTTGGGLFVNNQEATQSELQKELHDHHEEESDDWWEVQRAYDYETTDSLGDLFLVQVEEAQVIHKQHAELDDVQEAEGLQQTKASQDTLNTNGGFLRGSSDANSTSIEIEKTRQHEREDSLLVKQWQRIHVVQVSFAGLKKNEYEEERLVELRYYLSIDEFNEWEYQADVENQNSNTLMLGYQRRRRAKRNTV